MNVMKTVIGFKPFLAQQIRNGIKTETRRIMTPQPVLAQSKLPPLPCDLMVYGKALKRMSKLGFQKLGTGGKMAGFLYPENPFGDPGSILGIIEDHRVVDFDSQTATVEFRDGEIIPFDIAGNNRIIDSLERRRTIGRWLPPRFMFREFCRDQIVVSGSNPERLADIGEDSAIAEGVERDILGGWKNYTDTSRPVESARESFLTLWDFIHGENAAIQNPYIWAISFQQTSVLNPYA